MDTHDLNGHSNDVDIDGLLTATVTLAETQEKSKKSVVYKVVVHNETKSAVVHKKFSEFQTLYEKLKRLFPSAHLKFPVKRFFSSSYDNKLEGLNDFLYKICSNRYIFMTQMVIDFLDLQSLKERVKFGEADLFHDTSEDPDQTGRVNLGPSEKLHGKAADFEFLKVIGKGSFGKVLLAKHKAEDKMYAVKVLNKSHIIKKNEAKHIMSERNVLIENIQHPFLVGLHYSFQSSDKLYFVLDYVNGGELFYHLQKERSFPEVRGRFYAAEICSAIAYLHSLNIIYRDLKPENILLDCDGHVVLTDFGLCKEGVDGRETTSTFCGTPEYLAPEVLRKMPYNKTVDWWCLGCVLYEMLFGLPPFYSRDVNEMYQNILHKDLTFKPNVISLEAQHFLERLLQKQKERRLGAHSDSLEVKRHPFFSSINWSNLDERKITPPYDPDVDGDMDLQHFDPEFVREPVPASVGRSFHDRYATNTGANVFEGFSYVPPAAHLQEA